MIKAILIDAMSTIFRFKREMSKYEVYRRIVLELLGKDVPVEKIKEAYDPKREALESQEGLSHLEKWAEINKEILLVLFPEMAVSGAKNLGAVMSRKLSSDLALYTVSRDTRSFLKAAKEKGIMVIIASNQDLNCLQGMLKGFKLSKSVSQVYDSYRVGIEKPDPRFFQKILEEEELSPGDCVMIGNNPKNDVMGAEKSGLIGVLLDTRNRYPDHKGYKIANFKELWQLDIFKES